MPLVRVGGALPDKAEMRARWPRFMAGGQLLPDETPDRVPTRFRGRDQFATPTCIGFGVGAACAIYEALETGYTGLWSPLALFTLAKEWAKQDVRLSYEGTYSSAAWAVLQSLGLCEESDWPFPPVTEHGVPLTDDWWKPVTIGAFRSMGAHLLPHALSNADDARAWLATTARPFSFVAPAPRSFQLLGPGEVWRGPGPGENAFGDLHSQCAHRYVREGVVVLSSWGDHDRIIAWDAFDDGTCFDMTGPLHAA